MDKNSPYYGTIRGFALIKYTKPLEAARAVAVGPLQLQNNIITIEFAKADHATR
jgi:acetoacetate decarboxylase